MENLPNNQNAIPKPINILTDKGRKTSEIYSPWTPYFMETVFCDKFQKETMHETIWDLTTNGHAEACTSIFSGQRREKTST